MNKIIDEYKKLSDPLRVGFFGNLEANKRVASVDEKLLKNYTDVAHKVWESDEALDEFMGRTSLIIPDELNIFGERGRKYLGIMPPSDPVVRVGIQVWYPLYYIWLYSPGGFVESLGYSEPRPLTITATVLSNTSNTQGKFIQNRALVSTMIYSSPLYQIWDLEHSKKFKKKVKQATTTIKLTDGMTEDYKEFIDTRPEWEDKYKLARATQIIGSPARWVSEHSLTNTKQLVELINQIDDFGFFMFAKSMEPLIEKNQQWKIITQDNIMFLAVGKKPLLLSLIHI